MSYFHEFQVVGWENGGVDLIHQSCDGLVAAGGCICCEGNEVYLWDLLKAIQAHICEGAANG